jgi:hypothetical protein
MNASGGIGLRPGDFGRNCAAKILPHPRFRNWATLRAAYAITTPCDVEHSRLGNYLLSTEAILMRRI